MLNRYENRRQNFGLEPLLRRALLLLVGSLALVKFVNGLVTEVVGFDRLETMYYLTILFFSSLCVLRCFHRFFALYLFVLLLAVLLGVLLSGADQSRLLGDVRYYFRSYIIAILLAWIIVKSEMYTDSKTKKFFLIQWGVITFFVLLDFFFGFGRLDGFVKMSYFLEGNVTAFVLLVSWFYLFLSTKTIWLKISISLVTFLVFVSMSVKGAMLVMVALVVFQIHANFSKAMFGYKKRVYNLILFSLFITLMAFSEQVLYLVAKSFVGVLPDSEVFLHRLQEWDILAVLTSTRNLRVEELFMRMGDYSVTQLLFGIGFSDVLAKNLLIESDFFDTLQAFGIVGATLFYLPLLLAFVFLKKSKATMLHNHESYIFSMGVFYAMIFMSIGTGHILITPASMIVIGVVCGIYYVRYKRERMLYSAVTVAVK